MLDELRQIVRAMKNLAFAELHRVGRALPAQEVAEQTVLHALADIVVPEPAAEEGRQLWLAIGADRGFCGGFNDHLAVAVAAEHVRAPAAVWLVAGARLRQRLEDRLPEATWLPGCATSEEASNCVDTWLDAVLSYLDAPAAPVFHVLHHTEAGPAARRLLPMPALPAPHPGSPPHRYVARSVLMPGLVSEMLRVALLGALYQSLQQENRWRLAQMERARDHLEESARQLERIHFRERQTQITTELETLMSSLDDVQGTSALGAG
ncbi:hypothetical protein D8I24_4402 [Cupriavidus necator H850]|uniref:F0F1 ATP synthase subunit gamma n=1 Tax=Cupriavidus necator TaxID=106590 RepID=UPI00189288ED|nr:hypothetical protein D8I24_4402 [Cupriavidus necator H850]